MQAGQVLAVLERAEIGAAVEQARQAPTRRARPRAREALHADQVSDAEQLQDLTTASTWRAPA